MGDGGGDLSDGHAERSASCLSGLELEDAPNGPIKLDGNRQAIGTNFLTEVVENEDGTLSNKLIKVIENVNQTMGIDEAAFRQRSACRAATSRTAKRRTDRLQKPWIRASKLARIAIHRQPSRRPGIQPERRAAMTLINYLNRGSLRGWCSGRGGLFAEMERLGWRRPS